MEINKLNSLEAKLIDASKLASQDSYAPLKKSKRQAIFLNQSKRSSSIRAVREAKLISNLNPSDVKVVKICG